MGTTLDKITIILYVDGPSAWESEYISSMQRKLPQLANIFVINEVGFIAYYHPKSAKNINIQHHKTNIIANAFEAFNTAVNYIEDKDHAILFTVSDVQMTSEAVNELYNALIANEKHGIVVPRVGYLKEYENLPRSTVVLSFDILCFMIRGQLIENYGGFDTQNVEEKNRIPDLCMRFNAYGYSTIVANRAFINSNKSSKDIDKKDLIDDSIFLSRYPYYKKIEYVYKNLYCNPIDYFSCLLKQDKEKKSILFSLYNALPSYSGSVIHSIKELEAFYDQFNRKHNIHILINRNADNFFKLSDRYPNVFYPDTICGKYHLAFSPTQIFHIEHLIILHRHALKIMFTMQDIIGIRCAYNLAPNPEVRFLFQLSIKFADGICTFSDSAYKDIRTFFNSLLYEPFPKTKTVYLGAEMIVENNFDSSILPFKNYILLFGNHFAHKCIVEAIEAIKDTCSNINFIIVGLKEDLFRQPNIKTYPSGELETHFIQALYANCSAVLFPSQYEGFGLPILEAIQFGKPIILFDTELNRELFTHLLSDYAENALFFKYFKELPQIFDTLDFLLRNRKLKRLPSTFRNWYAVSKDIEELMDETLNEPVDYRKLEERFFSLQAIDHFHAQTKINNGSDPSFFTQVFLDTGDGYNEGESISYPVTGNETLLEFDIQSFKNFRQIRFDPMNISGIISIKSAQLISAEEKIFQLFLQSHNALILKSGIFLFDTDDPNIEFVYAENGNFKKMIIGIQFIAFGKDLYAYLYKNHLASIPIIWIAQGIRTWKHRIKSSFTNFVKHNR